MDKQDKSRSNLKDLRKTFTLDETTLKEINIFKGLHKSKSSSEALRGIIIEYKVLKEHNGNESSLKNPSVEETLQIGCPALINVPNKSWCCAKNAPRLVSLASLKICEYCWQKQQKEKTVSIPQTTPSLYKKPQKILCIGTGYWENPLKIQGRCANCKIRTFRTWAECQEKQASLSA